MHHGECVAWLRTLPDACVDAVVCDPPYAEIDRDYGRMTEPEWEAFAHDLVRESLRVLKPRGSAVFIIQPNSERVGRMRPWAFRFLAWCADDLVRETGGRVGMVQDAWWWNTAAMPTVHCQRERGLMRQSVKPCVWVGPEDCYRDQGSVLWGESTSNAAARASSRARSKEVINRPSGVHLREGRAEAVAGERGGVTPFNLLPMPNTDSATSAGSEGHGAGTPYSLASWWSGTVAHLPCGAGVVVYDGGEVVLEASRSLGLGTNNHAELSAIRVALAITDTPEWRGRMLVVRSDSMYAIGAMTAPRNPAPDRPNARLIAITRRLLAGRSVRFEHVKGHSSEPGNERADKLAGLARLRGVAALESSGGSLRGA